MKEKLKYIIAVIFIVIFTFSVVPKTFQNDTFYVIELGRQIMENGVDFQDHYSIHENLEYRYPHWAFDVINSVIFNAFGFQGIYILTQIFASVFMLLVFWNMLRKEVHFNLALISTLIVAYMMKGGFYARGQIISYSLFLLTYMLLENFVERPTFFKTLALFALSCIMANVHSTAWIMMLILTLPFIGEQIVYAYSLKGINERLLKNDKQKLRKAISSGKSDEEIQAIKEEIRHQEEFKEKYQSEDKEHKIIVTKKPNVKYISVAIIIMILGALVTPIKLTPFVYVLKTSVGNSLDYINEHLPIIPANSLEFLSFTIIMVALLGFTKSKLKLSDAFLILGLYLMSISSRRNVFLLVGLTAGIVVKMIDDFIKENTEKESKRFSKILFVVVCIASVSCSIYFSVIKMNDPYISEKNYPVQATEYIKNHLDYKNIRIYNRYDYGSYLLMEGVPVFLDSRCDLYTPEFNKGVTVFDDYMDVIYEKITISELMDQYQLEYAVVPVDNGEEVYMAEDDRYTELYKDKYFAVYQYDARGK